MWKWKDNPIVLHTACLASHQADVFGMQQHSWQSNSRWWTQNGGATVNVCCPIPKAACMARHQYTAVLAGTVASNRPTHWLMLGMFPPRQAEACLLTEAYNHYSLSFSTPLSSRQVLMCTRDSYMSCPLINVFFRSVFFDLSIRLSNCAPNNTACHLFVSYNGPNGWQSHLLRAIIWALSLLFSGLREDVLLFICRVVSNLCSG